MSNKMPAAYVVKNCQVKEGFGSSSAGVFELFAEKIISKGGVVFASAFSQDHTLIVKSARRISELEGMRGSKYVFGGFGETISECYAAIKDGGPVLFTGLPCQINALKVYLRNRGFPEPDNLLTVDLICHGAPSNVFFKEYLRWLAKRKGAERIEFYEFRSGEYSWGEFVCSYGYVKSGMKKVESCCAGYDPYYSSFLKGLTYRKCCYSCKFAKPQRVSDITLGDAWGVETMCPDFLSPDGVSLVLVSTPKGFRFFEDECKGLYDSVAVDFDLAASFNANLLEPSFVPEELAPLREQFEEAIRREEYDFIFDELLNPVRGVKGRILARLPCRIALKLRRLKAKF